MSETKRIVVTGATGLIGGNLSRTLIQRGYAVVVCSRDPAAARATIFGAVDYVPWQPEENGAWTEYIDGAYGVVNLEGGSIYTFGQRQTQQSITAETGNRVRGILGLVHGRRVLPQKALDLGYQFQFPTLASALHDLVDTESSNQN